MAGKTTKKSKKSAPRKAGTTAAAARPRRRSGAMKGVAKIPKLTTAAAIFAANSEPIIWAAKNTIKSPTNMAYIKAAGKKIIQPDSLAKTAKAALVGYGIGYVAKKYAPKIIKKPMAKIASKVM